VFHGQLLTHTMLCCPAHIVLYFMSLIVFLLSEHINDDADDADADDDDDDDDFKQCVSLQT